MDLLDNVVQPYAWGSRTAIPQLLGRAPDGKPHAELWLGAHPVASSKSLRQGEWRSLQQRIADDERGELGQELAERFHRLPFLLKVLAADEPLSLQAHPNRQQASEGFAREEAAGIARTAPHRNYKDNNHKPELIVALTPFDALCGFRPVADLVALFDALAVPQLSTVSAMVREWPDEMGLHAVFYALLSMPDAERHEVVPAVLQACWRHGEAHGRFSAECEWAQELGRKYPGDVGAVTSLMLNLVRLKPGEGIYLPAGNLHAYLRGVGVEVMASSDNVLRGGLTTKHVDVEELVSVLQYSHGTVPVVRPVVQGDEEVWLTPAPEFQLSRVDGARRGVGDPKAQGPRAAAVCRRQRARGWVGTGAGVVSLRARVRRRLQPHGRRRGVSRDCFADRFRRSPCW